MRLQSDFAILDVKRGRRGLLRKLEKRPRPVPVTITGKIVRAWGGDDGVSQEFEVEVDRVRVIS